MKTKLYSILIGSSFLFASCEKFLAEDPKSSITSQSFYTSKADLDAAMAGIAISFNLAWNQTGAPFFGSDDVTTHTGGNKKGFSDFDTFQATSSNDRMTVWWTNFYKTIKSTNALISNYSNATSASEEIRNQAAGFGYFYRAICYFYLTRTWGEVPMPLEFTLDERSNSTPEQIYAKIISDLENAEKMLPDAWDAPRRQNGIDIFPTAGSAKALLANVYLTTAGWPLKKTENYAKAAAKAKEVIDNKAKWGYELQSNFADLWKKDNQLNKEAVFGCYFNNAMAGIWNYGDNWGNGNQLGPKAFAAGTEGGWDEAYAEINFYNAFPSGPRKDATYQTVYYENNDITKPLNYTQLTHKHPFTLKYRDDESYDPVTHLASNWWGSSTVYMMRYAEVLLTYAEAQAMATNPDASAYDAINKVRTRAGLPNLSTGLSKEQFQQAVIAERGWEFTGFEPAYRWFDLLRTETVAKANSTRSSQEVPLVGQPNDVTHAFYWAPIPIVK